MTIVQSLKPKSPADEAIAILQLPPEETIFQGAGSLERMHEAVSAGMVELSKSLVEGWLARGLDLRTVLDRTYPYNLHSIHDLPGRSQ